MTEEVFYLIGPFKLVLILIVIFRDYYPEYRTELFTFVGTYLFFICGLKSNSTSIVIFNKTWEEITPFIILLACIITLVSVMFSILAKQKKNNLKEYKKAFEDMKERVDSIKSEYYRLCSDNLKFLFQEFFENSGGNGRVSLYKHLDNKFVLMGRFSINPAYNKKGREIYSDNEGLINIGWEKGQVKLSNIPTWVGNGREYKSFIRKYCEISDSTLKMIGMKSCSFFIKRIENEDARNPLGIIVFEQMQPCEINSDAIENILDFYKFPIETYLKSMKTVY